MHAGVIAGTTESGVSTVERASAQRAVGLRLRALLAAALLCVALGALAFALSRGDGSSSRATARSTAAASAYRVTPSALGLRAYNPAQRITSSFTATGASVTTAGGLRVGLGLHGVGYGSALQRVGSVVPKAHGARVYYTQAGLSEWYANGPYGLEQGFTLARAPARHASGPLTVAVALSGNAHASLARNRQSVTLSGSGASALRYYGLSASDARGRLLRSWLELRGGAVLLRVDARGAVYPVRIDPLLGEQTVYVANDKSNTVSPITVGAKTAGTAIKVGMAPNSVAITPNGRTAYVTNLSGLSVTPIEITNKNATDPEISAGETPEGIAITPDGKTAYVVNHFSKSVTPINLETKTAETTITVGEDPTGIAITPNGKLAYVTNEGSESVTPIEITNKNTPGAAIKVGKHPYGIAITPNGNTAYVANGESESVTPIEINNKNTPGSPITVGKGPQAIAITPNGETAYVTNENSETVSPIEITKSNNVGTAIKVGKLPRGIAITPDGKTAYVSNESSNNVTPIEITNKNTPGTAIAVGELPLGVAITPLAPAATVTTGAASEVAHFSAKLAATVNPNGSEVSACTLEYGTTISYGSTAPCSPSPGSGESAVAVSAAISGLAPNTEYHYRVSATNAGGTSKGTDATFTTSAIADGEPIVYVATALSNTVTPVEVATNKPGAQVKVGVLPSQIAITPDGKTALVSNEDSGSVTLIEVATDKAGSEIAVGSEPVGVAITPDGKTAYVANAGSNSVTPINIAAKTAGTAIPVGKRPLGIAITPNGKTAYVTNFEGASVTPINLGTKTAEEVIPVGTSPARVAITPDGKTAYVANVGSSNVSPITVATNTAGAPITVGSSPEGIAITPDGKTVYVADAGSNNVTPISVASNTAGSAITVGSEPDAIAITPEGKTAYVANNTGGSLTPIAVATNTAGAEVKVGSIGFNGSIAITPPVAPVVVTGSASEITKTSATVSATVNPSGGTPSACTFEYGLTAGYGQSVPCALLPGTGTSAVGVSAALSGLAPGRTYHYRVVATNNDGPVGTGSDATFKTEPPAPALASTEPPTSVTQSTAVLNGMVDPDGGEVESCVFSVQSETFNTDVQCEQSPGSGMSQVPVTGRVAGLSPNTLYTVKLTALNAGGGIGGLTLTFRTLPNPPAVVTDGATTVTHFAATLNATVNPEGGEVTAGNCTFEYGPTQSYGSTAQCETAPGSGTKPVAVAAQIQGLAPSATYHFRITATNTGGTSHGSDQTFKTSAIAPGEAIAYVPSRNYGIVTPIELATRKVGAEIRVGEEPAGVAITPNGKTVYVTNEASDSVTPIEVATDTPGAGISVGSGPEGIAITPNGQTAYVANYGGGSVTPIEITNKNTPGAEITVGGQPSAIAITPDGKTAYVTNNFESVTPIGLGATPKVGAAIGVGMDPEGVAITPDGSTAYVANRLSESVTPINVATNTAGATITGVGELPYGLAITPDGKTAYIGHLGNHTVTAVELATSKVGAEIHGGGAPGAFAITPDGKTVYAVNRISGSVTPIEVANNTVSGPEIPVGELPDAIAITPPVAPVVVTGSASEITKTSATVSATVNPSGGTPSACTFEYGLTAGYGQSVPCALLPGTGTSAVGVSAALSGLAPGRTYHYRVVATNNDGPVGTGSDATFKTEPPAPALASTEPPTSVTQSTAVLNGMVDPDGGEVESCVFSVQSETFNTDVQCEQSPGSGMSQVPVTGRVAGLSPNTLYTVKLTALNAGGGIGGLTLTFRTLPNPPAVVTDGATTVTHFAATLNATVNPEGGEVTAGNCTFEYGPTQSYGSTAQCETAPGSGTKPVAVSAKLTGLAANSTYHYRIVATNTGGTSHGSDQTFTTTLNAPAVVTGSASSIAQTTATLNATVNPEGGTVSAANCTFEYGPTESYGSSAHCETAPGSGSSPVAVSVKVTGLSANSGYHFRISATNATGTTKGSDSAFSTLPNAPAVVTGSATEVAKTSATPNATVNPEGGNVTAANCTFEYGPTESYGSSAHCETAPGSGTSPVGVSLKLAGLTANSGYHYRIVATNAGGTSYGADASFNTVPNAPTVTTGAASSITQTTATLNATVDPNGAEVNAANCKLEYGTSVSYGSSASCSPAPGSGTSNVSVSAAIASLSSNTTYHFRVAATNAGGTSYGSDASFKTEGIPEFGRCLKVATGKGKDGTATCTTLKASGSYEWFPAFGSEPLKKAGITTAIKAATKLLLETKGKTKIYCSGQTGKGEYATNKTLANVTLKLTGCYKTTETDRCENTATEGEIVANTLGASLGLVKEELVATKDKVGLELSASGGEIAQFNCESTSVTLRGSVILEGHANSMVPTVTLKAIQSKGVQKYTHFAGGTANEDILEMKIGSGAFEQTGLSLTTIQTNEEKVEANTIF